MRNEGNEMKYSEASNFNHLDSALDELGMLSARTNARREYLRENRVNMLLNPKYVSNVSIGLRVRHITPSNRYTPYPMPKREERHRTKSENNDSNDSSTTSLVKAIVETTVDNVDEMSQLKKAKSLESIIGENNKDVDLRNFRFPELEISNCIEKLHVDDR